MMTQKNFEAIAKAMRINKPLRGSFTTDSDYEYARNCWAVAIIFLADECARANPRFDRVKFYAACGRDI